MRRTAAVLGALGLICLFLGGAFLGFERVALDSAVYDRIQADLDVYEATGISREVLPRVTAVLAAYLRGERADIDVEEEVFGVYGPVFNENEKAHMVDVLSLFRLECRLKAMLLAAGVLLMAAVPLFARKETGRAVNAAFRGFLAALALMAVVGLLMWLHSGFDGLFLAFHRALFDNDLWLMDPRTDAMIRMLPAGFFQRIARESGLAALAAGSLLAVCALTLTRAAGSIINSSGRKKNP